MTLDEMFNEINKMTEITQYFHDVYIVQMEVKYLDQKKPEIITTILWHELGCESCIKEFMPKDFSWYDDWYHCCKKEDVKVLRYADIDHVWDWFFNCRNCKYVSFHCMEYDTNVDPFDGCSNWEEGE